MAFLHCFRTAVLMLILTSAVSVAVADSQETLPARIVINISWDIDEDNIINRRGSLSKQIAGTLELNPLSVETSDGEALTPVSLQYFADGLSGSYKYAETVTEKNPPKDCEPLLATYEGIGTITAAQSGLLRVQRMKHLASAYLDKLAPEQKQFLAQIPGQDLLIDYYDFGCAFSAQPSTVSGKSRENNSGCKYSDREKSLSLGNILLGFKIPSSGEMKGHRTWTTRAKSKPHLSVTLADLPDRMRWPAYKPAVRPGGNVTYNVTWAFGEAAKPIDVDVSTVSFKYTGGNQDQDLCLQLLHHGPEKPIKPPEWTDQEEIEIQPAAFVCGYSFWVKAVFKCKRPVKSAKIRAFEEVFDGKGFGGELSQDGDLEISDKEISGEFIIKTPQDVIGTHWVRWQWEGDIEFKDEPGKITAHLGYSEHTIYIVGGVPGENVHAYKYAVDLGCEWAKGLEGGKPALDAIWKNFWDIPAPDRNHGILSYKHKTPTPPGTTDELLTKGEGICGAWADFFKDTVGIHGIEISKTGIYPKFPGITDPICVKSEPGEFCFDHILVKERPAQGNLKPSRVFPEHVLNKYEGVYYDPSYHVMFSGSLNAFENKMFHGYCRSWEVLDKDKEIEETVNDLEEGEVKPECSGIPYDVTNPSVWMALFADCLIVNGILDGGCVPNSNECEVYETSY